MSRYEVIIELDSDLGRELIGEIFDQMLDDSIFGNQPIGLAVVEVGQREADNLYPGGNE